MIFGKRGLIFSVTGKRRFRFWEIMRRIWSKTDQNHQNHEDKNVFFMTIQKFIIVIYSKNPLKPAPGKGKKKSSLLTLCQHPFLFLQPIKFIIPLLKIGISV